MSATSQLTQVVFWAHAVGAVLFVAVAVAINKLMAELSLAPGGIESAPWARSALEHGVPASGVLFAVAVVGYGFAFLGGKIAEANPSASALGTVERVALAVPGSLLGKLLGIAGLVVFNGAIVLFLLDLGYRWVQER